MFTKLTTSVKSILQEHFGVTDATITWERPQKVEHGDFATAVAMQVAKKAEKTPLEIAKQLTEGLQLVDAVEKVEIAGPGYINVWLTPQTLLQALSGAREACTKKVKEGKPVIVEYSQPNIAKPLSAHHLLTTLIGQAIANIDEHLGHEVVKWNYIGDWGTQFGKLAVAVGRWGDDRKASDYTIDELLELYVRFHAEADKDESLLDEGRETFRKMEDGDAELRSFWEDVVETTKGDLAAMYERMNVSFDTDIGESFYEEKMEPILSEGIEKKVFVEGEEGALIVEFPGESNMPPYLVRKKDGATLYSTRDIAQMRYRMDEYDPEQILIVTDIAQKLHFEQLEATCEQLGWELPEFENVLVGRMRYEDKSMSTRKGNVLKLEEVLNEAVRRADAVIAEHGDSIQADDSANLAEMMGIGAVSYGILSQNRKQDIVFDWDKMLSFEGNSAPYLQYTHARTRSVLSKAGVDGELEIPKDIQSLSLKERILIGTLLQFRHVLEEARAAHMPHILANYLFTLGQDYNAFYNEEPILKAPEPERTLRLLLTGLTADVLKTGAGLLTLRVPDRM